MTLPTLRFDDHGLVPVIAQDAATGEVLMLAYADREAVEATLATRQAHYHSRSRGELWRKGATSGNVQRVVEVRYDCDEDALLYRVEQTGPACHTGHRSCFYRTAEPPTEAEEGAAGAAEDTSGATLGEVMTLLQGVVAQRLRDLPEGSYVRRMHERGLGYVAQKVVEEAGESVVAALEHKNDELVAEASDLLFHLTVLLAERGLTLNDVAAELARRHRDAPER
ncbi:MAG: bifunctional phosphoribosyl-AMP cyclohydrolase/phosphoribosyl-ATP diphosphatase HisIE [Deinococcales bacterium]